MPEGRRSAIAGYDVSRWAGCWSRGAWRYSRIDSTSRSRATTPVPLMLVNWPPGATA